jgi:hypothetical protein
MRDGSTPSVRKPPGVFFSGGDNGPVEPADSIGRLGFSRWYERRLIEGHAWFVSAFSSMILVAVCMEELTFKGGAARLLAYVSLVLAATALCIYGIFRYQRIIAEAERIGERATCPGCGIYARFKLFSASSVRCRKCSHEWRLID